MNRYKRSSLAAFVAVLFAAGCASLQPARMALPPNLQTGSERIPVTGVGGSQRGSFAAGAFSGEFSRSATRLAFFDTLYERYDSSVAFSLRGPDINGDISAECRMQERVLTLGVVSFSPKPMAYSCAFAHEGRPLPARLEIQEAHEGGARPVRRGEIGLDRVVLQIRSVHGVEGSPLQLASPIGYIFERDGVAVGAVEVNGAPVVVYAPETDAAERRAVLTGALALGLFWDPANAQLGKG